MLINALNIPSRFDAIQPAARREESHFSRLIQPRDTAMDRAPQTKASQARQAIEDFVAMAFVQPILAQSQRDPFRVDKFHGGRGEEVFQEQLNGVLAQRVTAKANLPMVDQMCRKFMASSAGEGKTEAVKFDVHG